MTAATVSPAVRFLARSRRPIREETLRWLMLSCGVAAVALPYAFLVPAGLPYDEPSHWGYVRFLAEHGGLPVLGHSSVSYEAQMGPVAYIPQAFALRLCQALGVADAHALIFVRAAGVLWLMALFVLVTKIIHAARPNTSSYAGLLGAVVAVLNPMVVGMSMSIQNDTLAMVLIFMLILRVMRLDEPVSLAWAVGSGVLGALALLAKLSLAPAIAVLLIWPMIRFRRRGLLTVLIATGTAAAASVWWFLRNLDLYGDVTGRAGVAAIGVAFPPLGLSPGTLSYLATSAVTYLWLPVEYYRNTIHTPGLVELVVLIAALVVLAATVYVARDPAARLLVAVAVSSVLAWAGTALLVQAVAFRVAYPALALWAVGASALVSLPDGLRRLARRFAIPLLLLLLGGLHLWILVEVARVTYSTGGSA